MNKQWDFLTLSVEKSLIPTKDIPKTVSQNSQGE